MPDDGRICHLALLERCRAGDQRAWADLVHEFGPLVFAVARRVGLPEDVCEDVAQATFAALAGNLAALREPGALPGWLVTTARREAIAHSKAATKRRLAPLEHDPRAWDEVPALETLEAHHRLRTALGRLGPMCRDLLCALYFEGARPDYKAVAERLGMAMGSIGPTRRRCLERLGQIMQEEP